MTIDNESNPMLCPRCETELQFVGTQDFREGGRGSNYLLGDMGRIFEDRKHFDFYVCPRCGRVELFVDGIGEIFRPH